MKKFRESDKNRFIACFIVMLIFLISLGVECYCTSEKCRLGIDIFITGFFEMFFGGAAITWLANPLFIIGVILTFKGSKVSALVFSALAVTFCLTFLLFNNVIEDEAGNYRQVISYKLGYWLWTLSTFLLLTCNLIFRKVHQVTDNRF